MPSPFCLSNLSHAWKPQAHVDHAWDINPSLHATSLISNPNFQPTKIPLLLLTLMVVFSLTPGWFTAGGPGQNTITKAEFSSELSETQRCRWMGWGWGKSYWKRLAQLVIAQREFVFTPNTAWQRHWPDESVGVYRPGYLAESVLWLGVDNTLYPRWSTLRQLAWKKKQFELNHVHSEEKMSGFCRIESLLYFLH